MGDISLLYTTLVASGVNLSANMIKTVETNPVKVIYDDIKYELYDLKTRIVQWVSFTANIKKMYDSP